MNNPSAQATPRYDETTVRNVLAQVAADAAACQAQADALRQTVRAHFSRRARCKLEVADAVENRWYGANEVKPDYVLYHTHIGYVACQAPWLRKRFDKAFPHPKRLYRSDAEIQAGFRLTDEVPGVGTVVVDFFEEVEDHQGCF